MDYEKDVRNLGGERTRESMALQTLLPANAPFTRNAAALFQRSSARTPWGSPKTPGISDPVPAREGGNSRGSVHLSGCVIDLQ